MSLFPVKLAAIVSALKSTQVLARLSHAPSVQAPPDGKVRLILCSPEVHEAATHQYGDSLGDPRMLRKRLALDPDASFVALSEETVLELYNGEGVLVSQQRAIDLPFPLATAVEAELFHEILKAKGVDIPML